MGRFPYLNGPCTQSIMLKTGNTFLLRCSLFTSILLLTLRPDFIIVPPHRGTVHVQFSGDHGNGTLDIYCGCGNLKAPRRRPACLYLKGMAEFYVGGTGKENATYSENSSKIF